MTDINQMNDTGILKKRAEDEMRELNAIALYNNLVWWGKDSQEVHEATLNKALNILSDIILEDIRDQFVVTIPKGKKFYRARKIEVDEYGESKKGLGYTDDRLYGFNWKESKEPPIEKAKAGRMSYEKESALYLASDEATACSEVKPELRQMISIAKFFSEEEVEIIDFAKLNFSCFLGMNDEKYDASAIAFLERVKALFTTPFYDKDYRVTQKIAKYFRDKGYQGFKYRSFYTGGDNYTFFQDNVKKFRWEDSRIVINYAVANLFLSVDRIEGHTDVRNVKKVEEKVEDRTKDKLFYQTMKMFSEKAKLFDN